MTLMVTWLRCWTWNWNWTLAVVGSQILCPWCGSHFLLCSTPLSHRKPGPKPVVPRCQWRVSHIHSYYSHGHISHPLTQLSLTPLRPLSSFLLQACVPHLAVARTDVRHFVCARVARDLIIFFFLFPFLLFFFFLAFIMLRARARLGSEEREGGVSVWRRVGVAVAFAYAMGASTHKVFPRRMFPLWCTPFWIILSLAWVYSTCVCLSVYVLERKSYLLLPHCISGTFMEIIQLI